jgi:23S rRNA (pseudouridine1915-N3)-methyltransferase
VQLVVVGGTRGPLGSVIGEFERRAAHYWKLEIVEVGAGVRGGKEDPDRVRQAEGERIQKAMAQGLEVWSLTRDGKCMGSAELAEALSDLAVRGYPGAAILIGGAFGLSADLLERSTRRLSLSSLTLPHEIARLVLVEQLYRAGTILRGEPYHKGPGGRSNVGR